MEISLRASLQTLGSALGRLEDNSDENLSDLEEDASEEDVQMTET